MEFNVFLFGTLFYGLLLAPIIALLLWVFSITITVVNFNWIFVVILSLILGSWATIIATSK